MRKVLAKLGLLFLSGFSVVSANDARAAEDASEQNSYPYDPTCPWGRVSDGKGMLVRCLGVTEAKALATGKSAKVEAPEAELSAVAVEEPSQPELAVDVEAVKADEGELTGAKLAAQSAKTRYLACIDTNGGVAQPSAEVVVRFLVRERGRAEGVSVKSFKGLSKQAAKCVANVVDRRHVGVPETPLVGASVRIVFSMKSNAEAPAKP